MNLPAGHRSRGRRGSARFGAPACSVRDIPLVPSPFAGLLQPTTLETPMAANNPGTGQPSSWSREANAQTDTNDFSGEKQGSRTRPVELVQQKATEVTDRLADSAQSTLEQAKGRVAEQVRTVANVM